MDIGVGPILTFYKHMCLDELLPQLLLLPLRATLSMRTTVDVVKFVSGIHFKVVVHWHLTFMTCTSKIFY